MLSNSRVEPHGPAPTTRSPAAPRWRASRMSEEQAAQVAPLLKALADPVRLRLLSMVLSHEGGEACVCDLTAAFDLSQPTISHHLKVLHESGLLDREQARRLGLLPGPPRGDGGHARPCSPRVGGGGPARERHRARDAARPRRGRRGRCSGCPPSTGSCRCGSALAMAARPAPRPPGPRPGRRPVERSRSASVSLPIALGLLVMMYPVLAKVRYDRLDTVTGDRRLLVSSLVLNWVVGPALMFALAWLLPARPARVPHRPDHRRPGPLHRHGPHLERPRLRRPRGRRRPGRAQLGLPGRRLRRARLVLPRRCCPAGSACPRPRCDVSAWDIAR